MPALKSACLILALNLIYFISSYLIPDSITYKCSIAWQWNWTKQISCLCLQFFFLVWVVLSSEALSSAESNFGEYFHLEVFYVKHKALLALWTLDVLSVWIFGGNSHVVGAWLQYVLYHRCYYQVSEFHTIILWPSDQIIFYSPNYSVVMAKRHTRAAG